MKKLLIIHMFVAILMFNCGGSDDGGGDPEPQPKKPTAASLVFPNQNSECTEGTNITATNSTVNFQWSAGSNTDSYELTLKNLLTGTTSKETTTSTNLNIELLIGTPYSWFVTSKSSSVTDTATSATWKFYNAGEGIVSYAPFPATAVGPTNGEALAATTTVTLEWTGSDVDNDIAHYDIYFGEADTTLTVIADNQSSTATSVSVSSGKTYNWYVITIDNHGNSSISETFKFTVD